jgi:hypothetical protein
MQINSVFSGAYLGCIYNVAFYVSNVLFLLDVKSLLHLKGEKYVNILQQNFSMQSINHGKRLGKKTTTELIVAQ